MLPDRHPTAPRFSRPLLHLISLGLAGAVMISFFGLASFSLLNGGKAAVDGSGVGQSAVKGELAPAPDNPAPSGATVSMPGQTKSSNLDAAKPLPASSAQDLPTPEAPLAKGEAEPVPDLPAPDHGSAAAGAETSPASPREDQSADATRPPGINQDQAQQPAPSPVAVANAPGPPPTASQPAVPPANMLPSDQQRDQTFQSSAMEEKQLSSGRKANPAPIRTPPAQRQRSSRSESSLLAHNSAFRSRVSRECGPIKDPPLYRHCVATFGAHYR